MVGEKDKYQQPAEKIEVSVIPLFRKKQEYGLGAKNSSLETAENEEITPAAVLCDNTGQSSRSLYSSPRDVQEQFLMEQFYASNTPSYNPAEAVGTDIHSKDAGAEAGYALSADQDSEVLDAREAEDTFKNIQYAAITGNTSDVSPDERRKFDLWIKFNPALFKLFEAMYSITRDVNYGNYM